MKDSRSLSVGRALVWRQFLIGQTFGVIFSILLFLVEPVWLLRAAHEQFGASLITVLAVYTAFGWALGAVMGTLWGLAGIAVGKWKRDDGTVPGVGPALGFLLIALFVLRMESAQTLRSLPANAVVSLVAAVLVWVGLAYLGRRFLERNIPPARRSCNLKLLALACFLAMVVPAAVSRIEPPRPAPLNPELAGGPNVVLIVVDALRPDHLSAYNYERVTSPNLDRFAEGAALFENAYSHGSRTEVAMPALYTSFYPAVSSSAERGAVTIAELCRSNGYTTVCVSGRRLLDEVPSTARGFDFTVQFETARFGLSVYRALAFLGIIDGPGHPPRSPNAAAVTDRAIWWLHGTQDQPLFLMMNYGDLHPPYAPPSEFVGYFSEGESGIDADLLFARTAAMAAGGGPVRLESGELQHLVDLYDASIQYVDAEIGRFLDALEMAELERETLVIVTADRGTEFLEHGSLYESGMAAEESIRVPLIVGRVPSSGVGRRIAAIARHVDVLPTVAGSIRARVPIGVHGAELALQGGAGGAGEPRTRRSSIAEGDGRVSLNQAYWKMLYLEEAGRYELYDLSNDPYGVRDVSAAYADRCAEMEPLITEYREMRVGAPAAEPKLMAGDVIQ